MYVQLIQLIRGRGSRTNVAQHLIDKQESGCEKMQNWALSPPPMSQHHILCRYVRLRLPTIIMTKFQLVIFSLADYLLAGWSEKDDVFVLCCVAALDVTEKGVWVHNPRVTKCHQVLV